MRALILGVKIELVTLALVVIVLAGLGLAGCAGTDARKDHLLACETYTSALEKAALWKDLGKLSDAQVVTLRSIDRSATPLCMGAEPSADGTALILRATDSLEVLVLGIVIEKGN